MRLREKFDIDVVCLFDLSELIEHTPYGTGIPARGAFMRTELFGSKFYAGHVVKRFPEPSISFLQGRIAFRTVTGKNAISILIE